MRLAVIADIHSNLAALDAVLAAIDRAAVDRLLCLGDVVGYNAEPAAVMARLRRTSCTFVAGNHDRVAAGAAPAVGTNAVAREALLWTRAQLGDDDRSFLRQAPVIMREREFGFAAVHGCFLREETHVSGYATPTMIEPNLRALAAMGAEVGFCGHTHVPYVAWLGPDGCEERSAPALVRWPQEAEAVLINPGAVGQPRDGDRRASFAIVDLAQRTAEIRRVPYDIGRPARAIIAAGLPTELADRLFEGR